MGGFKYTEKRCFKGPFAAPDGPYQETSDAPRRGPKFKEGRRRALTRPERPFVDALSTLYSNQVTRLHVNVEHEGRTYVLNLTGAEDWVEVRTEGFGRTVRVWAKDSGRREVLRAARVIIEEIESFEWSQDPWRHM